MSTGQSIFLLALVTLTAILTIADYFVTKRVNKARKERDKLVMELIDGYEKETKILMRMNTKTGELFYDLLSQSALTFEQKEKFNKRYKSLADQHFTALEEVK
ncbi:hypothetical protein ACFP7A_09015 [Sporolactobacillus kofuensis]|uniref:Uncharacterized protein n=1 Tax=Sporolactobacillus kofuensis TaxID=269672 RepID=A0ABW1WEU9_9BACL|nr:hypothetical protein [Sporolactobacillus kofuensis]MCO7176136.1 hypothetical protein [Sporolactobacillus kofuensis]